MKRAITTIVTAALLALALPAIASAAPGLLWQVSENGPIAGSGAGELSNPRSVAVDHVSGHVYVSESRNARISEFDPWGQFIKAFGWRVNAQNPEEKLQVCTQESGCLAGREGDGAGQLSAPQGIAVDSAGSIYVFDRESHRVQKFDSEGHFLFMLGGGVNKTKVEAAAPEDERNLCPVDPDDVCQTGTLGTGNGQFATQTVADTLSVGPGDTVYFGDVGRIQKFDAAGHFVGEVKGEVAGTTVDLLEVDGSGDIYAKLNSGPNILKLGSSGEKLATFVIPHPSLFSSLGMTLGTSTGNVYAVDDPDGFGTVTNNPRVVVFDSSGDTLIPTKEEKEAEEAEPPEEPFPFAQFDSTVSNQAEITGLSTSSACGIDGEDLFVTYNYRGEESLLRAYGPNPDPSVCPPPEVPPLIVETYATSVDADGATVQAKINTKFWNDTTYYVQYGTGKCSDGACSEEQPSAPGSVLNSKTNLAVPTAGVFLPGLSPDTTYHYRFVAQSGGGGPTVGDEATFTTPPLSLSLKVDCPNQVFRTGPSAPLADCRAYEMVSPVEKEGADVVVVNAPNAEVPARMDRSSILGDDFTYSAYRAFGEAEGSPYSSQYLATRTAEGWSNHSISPPRGRPLMSIIETGDTEYQTFSADLCQGWLRVGFEVESELDPEEIEGYANLYQHEACGVGVLPFKALTTVTPPHNPAPQYFLSQVEGTSSDGRCAVFHTYDALTLEAPDLGEQASILYESCNGVLRLVAVLPDGTPSPTPSVAGTGVNLLSQFQIRGNTNFRAVSADGTRIYWTAAGQGSGPLYLRINADQPQSAVVGGECTEPEMACTLPVSAKVSDQGARFESASIDGRRAIFGIGSKLYEYKATAPAKAKAKLIAGGVDDKLGLLGASEDLSRIYFASSEALAPGAIKGNANLYFRERGESPRFIGALASVDLNTGLFESRAISSQPGNRAARVSPDGIHAAFMSAAPLTGYDNTDQRNDNPDQEVFLYDAAANGGEGKLVCVSCDPSGARPVGRNIAFSENTRQTWPVWAAARIPTWPSALYASRPLSDDGSRLFFDSFSPLVQRDTNGKADVYEWQSAGSQGDCEELGAERYVESSAGCLSLISSGESDQDSEFIDADSDGSDVFFTTGASLLSQDPGLIDVYDARSGGGFPVPPVQPPSCEGEACQSPPEAPNDPTPASSSYEGAGNVREPIAGKQRCGKGKVRKKGRCATKRRVAGKSNKRSQRNANGNRRNHR